MKKSTLIVLIAIISFISFFSCGDGGTGLTEYSADMNAMVNASNWRASQPNARVSDNSISVYGTSSNGQSMQIIVMEGEVGEYQLNANSGHKATFISNTSSAAIPYTTDSDLGSGRIIISALDSVNKTVSGKYNFRAYQPSGAAKSITDGTFAHVPYRYIHDVDTSVYENNFQANYNTQSWSPMEVDAIENDTAIIISASIPTLWEEIVITLPKEILSGINDIEADPNITIHFLKGFYDFPATNGSVTIGYHDLDLNNIRGTFFFNFVDENEETQSITNGEFDVYYVTHISN